MFLDALKALLWWSLASLFVAWLWYRWRRNSKPDWEEDDE